MARGVGAGRGGSNSSFVAWAGKKGPLEWRGDCGSLVVGGGMAFRTRTGVGVSMGLIRPAFEKRLLGRGTVLGVVNTSLSDSPDSIFS